MQKMGRETERKRSSGQHQGAITTSQVLIDALVAGICRLSVRFPTQTAWREQNLLLKNMEDTTLQREFSHLSR